MAKAAKTRKPVSSRSKGFICLVLLLALTVFVSCLALTGMKLDADGVHVLLPWVPASSQNWLKSIPLDRTLGGGSYIEYSASLPEDAETTLEDVARVIRARLSGNGEGDHAVTVKGGDTIRMELRRMDDSRLASVRGLAVMQGRFEIRNGDDVILTQKELKGARITTNSAGNGYVLVIEPTAEGAKALLDTQVGTVSLYVDGELANSYASVGVNGEIVLNVATSGSAYYNYVTYSTAVNIVYLLQTGAVEASLTMSETGDIAPSAGGTLSVILIVALALLVLACLYMILTGKLTGLSGIWTVWCAVLLMMFFFTTIVIPSITAANVVCLIALLLGLLLAIFTAVTRTEAISRQIGEGYGPKQASKLGFRTAARQVWIVHGAALALSLILMIFAFSRSIGYTLCAGVVASAIVVPLMRAFQACFTAITGVASLFGKKAKQ